MIFNFKKDSKINDDNYSSVNPIDKNNVRRKKINGNYIYEKFYLIDFLDIKENSYVISSFGRIFSLITSQELTPSFSPKRNNYKTITLLDNNGNRRKFPLSVLIARAFIPKTISDKKMNRIYVHHKNWDNDYNYYWNLEWRSPSEILLMSQVQNNKDTEESDIVKVVCKLLQNGETIVDIFDIIEGKLSKDKISKIKSRKIYTEISDKYAF